MRNTLQFVLLADGVTPNTPDKIPALAKIHDIFTVSYNPSDPDSFMVVFTAHPDSIDDLHLDALDKAYKNQDILCWFARCDNWSYYTSVDYNL